MYTTKKKKIVIDVLMIAGMFFSMSFHLFGVGVHKGIGLLTWLLFIAHNILNRQWYRGLLRGKYTPARIAHTVTNVTVLLAMIGVMVSGIMLSKELAAGYGDAMTAGHMLHNASSYVGCIGIALHIGFHLSGRTNHTTGVRRNA